MSDQFSINAVWAARYESSGDCAERTQLMMRDLERCHKLFDRWNDRASSLADALKHPLVPTREGLAPLFEPVEPIAGERPGDRGFSFGCWNGRPSALGICLRIDCGSIDTSAGQFNQIWLDLPCQSPRVETLYQPDVLERVMRAIVNAWEPDSVNLLSDEYHSRYLFPERQQAPWPPMPQGPEVGWFTYLSASRLGKLSGTPPCDEVITLRDRGSFFIISREHLFSIDSADDVARIRELKAYLEANHALEPLPWEEPRRIRRRKSTHDAAAGAEPAAKPRGGKTAARPKTPSRRKKA